MADRSLNPLQEKAALLLAEGCNQSETGRRVGRTYQSIRRWLEPRKGKPSPFFLRVEELRQDILAESKRLIKENLLNNVKTIQAVADGEIDKEIAPTRLRAAQWLAEKVLGKDKTETPDPRKKAREAAMELEMLAEDDADELLNRGVS